VTDTLSLPPSPTPSDDPLLSVAQVAQRLGVCTLTVRRRIKAGVLGVHRIGRSIRISEAGLQAYLVRCHYQPGPFDEFG
jgi:excisionase family DNA binding protein